MKNIDLVPEWDTLMQILKDVKHTENMISIVIKYINYNLPLERYQSGYICIKMIEYNKVVNFIKHKLI